jgi:hypothetical protein
MKALQLLTACSLLSSAALAGTSGKVTTPVTPAPEALGLTGSVSLGYDSEYYFRGLWFSSNNVWGSANVSIPVAEKLSLNLGALYTSSASTDISGAGNLDYSELDLIAGLSYDATFAKFGLVFTNYHFFDTFSGSVGGQTFGFAEAPDSTISGARDLGLTVAIPVGAANIYLGAYHDFKIDAQYFEAGLDYTLKITEKLSLVPSATIGLGNGYYSYPQLAGTEENGWTAVRVGLAAPYKITDTVTLTPYIAGNFALETREALNTVRGKNDLFGGVSLSVSF